MVSSAKKSSRSISPESPQSAIIRRTSLSMVAAWPFICSPRSAALCSISLRRSGSVSKTTPFAEDRRHERICRGLVEIVVAGPEEELVGLRAGQQHHLLAGQLELCRRRRTLRGHALHQADRVVAELLEVAVLFFRRRIPAARSGCHDWHPFWSEFELLTFLGRVGKWRLRLELHVGDEAAARRLGDERDGPGDVAGRRK